MGSSINKLMKKSYFITICALLSMILSGCVIFKGNNIPKAEFKELKSVSSKKIKIFIRWEFDFSPTDHSILTYEDREKLFDKVLKESKCCEVVQKQIQADIVLEGKSYDQRNGTVPRFFDTFSLQKLM